LKTQKTVFFSLSVFTFLSGLFILRSKISYFFTGIEDNFEFVSGDIGVGGMQMPGQVFS